MKTKNEKVHRAMSKYFKRRSKVAQPWTSLPPASLQAVLNDQYASDRTPKVRRRKAAP